MKREEQGFGVGIGTGMVGIGVVGIGVVGIGVVGIGVVGIGVVGIGVISIDAVVERIFCVGEEELRQRGFNAIDEVEGVFHRDGGLESK
jgi:hypothetical protein